MTQLTNGKHQLQLAAICLILMAIVSFAGQPAQAGQGCPFDDGSCQDYCNQQGCNLGYCGHFAWIQCICRKCGDEWSWYDKVRYNPDKTVNQTELDSLKLNGTAPLILTNSATKQQQQQQQQVAPAKTTTTTTTTTTTQQPQAPKAQPAATLTTLLIPDLSDGTKVDLNDIPDEENSEKFLDYLAKNHEKLVQAQHRSGEHQTTTTTTTGGAGQHEDQSSGEEAAAAGDDDDDEQPPPEETSTSSSITSRPSPTEAPQEETETVEIQISSSNNNSQQVEPTSGQQSASAGAGATGQVARLLRMAVADEQQLGTDLGLDS